MASLSLYCQFKTNLMSNRKVIEFILLLKSAKAHGKHYIKVKPHPVGVLLRNRLLAFRSLQKAVKYSSMHCMYISGIQAAFLCLLGCKLKRTVKK